MVSDVVFGIIIGFIFISLVVLFCVLLVKLYIHKVKSYTKVIFQKDLDFQKALNSTIIETQEQVLTNISQDLHDDAGQQLTYINFQLENLKLDSPELQQLLQPVSASVDQLSQSVRRISHSLNNQLLTQQDLLKAIATEVDRIQQNRHITIKLEIDESGAKTFETNEQIVIYRIFQEILNNILKHSKATEIAVSIGTSPGFKMEIRDNGKGFDYESTKKSSLTLGLQNMIGRAAIINYSVAIQSAPDQGTTIILSQ
ncbi:MAG TPA: histidine kinase [Flavobacterium sp.]|jgi:signal transduction histidine kinase